MTEPSAPAQPEIKLVADNTGFSLPSFSECRKLRDNGKATELSELLYWWMPSDKFRERLSAAISEVIAQSTEQIQNDNADLANDLALSQCKLTSKDEEIANLRAAHQAILSKDTISWLDARIISARALGIEGHPADKRTGAEIAEYKAQEALES